jgi:hypothetical protein
MKTKLTQTEERLLDLFEKGFFNELTLEEQRFVRMNTSEYAFNLEHKLRFESKRLYQEVTPNPLLLQKKNGQIMRFISVSVSSAAAAALLTYYIVSQQFDTIKIMQKPVYLMADTVFVPKVDTIIKFLNGKTNHLKESSFNPSNIEQREPFISQEELPPILFLDEHHKAVSLFQDRKDWTLINLDKSDVLNTQR